MLFATGMGKSIKDDRPNNGSASPESTDAVELAISQVNRGAVGKFYSTKTYGNEEGLSCCFRQWRADHSHCSKLHGYAIGVKVVFECDTLDERFWVVDFGGLKEFRQWLHQMFDHTVVISWDDPSRSAFQSMEALGLIDLRFVDSVGCESFAKLTYDKAQSIVSRGLNQSARVYSVEVFEHGANSAIYRA